MSYDYNKLLEEIRNSRSIEPQTPDVIQETLNLFTTLSTKCPMTPLLWMLYAYDAGSVMSKLDQDGALEVTCQILELGLAEFPNCAMLRLFHLDCVISGDNKSNDDMKGIWEDILASICVGCNGGSDEAIIVSIFNLYTNFMVKENYPKEEILKVFLLRGGLFMKDGNQSLRSEMDSFTERHGISFTASEFESLESSRQYASKNLNFLGTLEDDVLVAMGLDGVASPPDLSLFLRDEETMKENHCSLTFEWSKILEQMDMSFTYLMGFGMINTSKAFSKYAQGLIKQVKFVRKLIKEAENEEIDHNKEIKALHDLVEDLNKMLLQIYERGVAECPTVEIIWEKYIKHLLYILHEASSKNDMNSVCIYLNLSKGVVARAVRNCPYSVKLFSLKMAVVQEEVQAGVKVLEPDDLMGIVTESIDLNFFPSPKNYAEIYLNACSVVKRRILYLVSKATSDMAFDEAESLTKQTGKKRKRGEQTSSNLKSYQTTLSDDTEEEIEDLVDDLREMYDTADNEMRKKFKEMTELREMILRERAETEAYLLMHLSSFNYEEVIEMYEKMIRVHQLPHPDSWRCYINFMKGNSAVISQKESHLTSGSVAANFRFIRSLFHRSMTCTKKERDNKEGNLHNHDYILSIKSLCRDFIAFENSYGSTKTQESARKMTKEKLFLYDSTQTLAQNHPNVAQANGNAAKEPEKTVSENKEEGSTKNSDEVKVTEEVKKMAHSDSPTSICQSNDENKKQIHFVTLGKLKYPAHPFTVHISNLSKVTTDMDVYELLKDKCGSIVHVRIFREKVTNRYDGPPESKCAGLVQFEEKESVERALELDGEIGLNEKLLQISRSHQPAVSVVPPGMHRIKPKGQGKSTKRNQKRKERRDETKKEGESNNLSGESRAGIEKTITESDVVESKKDTVQTADVSKSKSSANSILNFRPRGVSKQKRRKAFVAINPSKS